MTKLPPHARARLGLGYVPQGREIFPRLTVEENLRLGLATQPPGASIPLRIFEMFPVLAEMLGRRGGDLSGGQQQQLAIGRALAMEPRLLVLDEPTEGIQPSIIKDIERAIRRLAAEGEMAILLVEQYYDFARSLADRYVVLSRGEVIKAGKGADMEADGVGPASPSERRHGAETRGSSYFFLLTAFLRGAIAPWSSPHFASSPAPLSSSSLARRTLARQVRQRGCRRYPS